MENQEQKAKEILKKYNQTHIIKWLDKQEESIKQKIIEQVLEIDLKELEDLYQKVQRGVVKKDYSITPIHAVIKEKISQTEKCNYIQTGEEILKNNKYAVVTMAGGQGTRLGHNGPKGSFKINLEPEEKYLFQIIIEQLIEANQKYNITIPYYVMTSVENNKETIAFFEKMNYFNYPKEYVKFFIQAEEPLVNKEGKLLIGENKTIKFASNGNGEIYKSMKRTGIIDDMKQKDIEWVVVTGIDNVLAKAVDPLFIGLTIEQKNKIASKSVVKRTPKESGGVFAKANGKPGIIEYVEIPENIANDKTPEGEYLYADINIVNHLFNITALEEIANKVLPYHTAVKNCRFLDAEGNVQEEKIYKFEKFIFDGFVYLEEMTLLRVKREEEFAPIKNKEGEDSPQTAKKMYEDCLKRLKNE